MEVEALSTPITPDNVQELVRGSTVVVDALDNWRTRFLLNQACVKLGVPLVHAGVHSFYGQATTILPGRGPCLRCILPTLPPEEKKVPILGVTAGILGLIEALEALKIITGIGRTLAGKLLYFDGETTTFTLVRVERRRDCPVCGVKRPDR